MTHSPSRTGWEARQNFLGPLPDLFLLPVRLVHEHERRSEQRATVLPLKTEKMLGAPRAEVISFVAQTDECHRLPLEIDPARPIFEQCMHMRIQLPLLPPRIPRTRRENDEISSKQIVLICALRALNFDGNVRTRGTDMARHYVDDMLAVAAGGCADDMNGRHTSGKEIMKRTVPSTARLLRHRARETQTGEDEEAARLSDYRGLTKDRATSTARPQVAWRPPSPFPAWKIRETGFRDPIVHTQEQVHAAPSAERRTIRAPKQPTRHDPVQRQVLSARETIRGDTTRFPLSPGRYRYQGSSWTERYGSRAGGIAIEPIELLTRQSFGAIVPRNHFLRGSDTFTPIKEELFVLRSHDHVRRPRVGEHGTRNKTPMRTANGMASTDTGRRWRRRGVHGNEGKEMKNHRIVR